MDRSKIVTLTTDFGELDTYVGQMKGAILAVAPEARVVDLCHAVPAHDVGAGAFLLETGFAAFPSGTVHVAVVDPGVGTARRMLAVEGRCHWFVGPDNGVLARALERESPWIARAIEDAASSRPRVAPTFAGRDVFAPVAAWLVRGIDPDRLGPRVDDLVGLPVRRPELGSGRPTRVSVLGVDRFGNATLDVSAEALGAALGRALDASIRLSVTAGGRRITRFHRTYADAREAEPFLLLGSAGYLEVALARSRADEALGLRPGTEVELEIEA